MNTSLIAPLVSLIVVRILRTVKLYFKLLAKEGMIIGDNFKRKLNFQLNSHFSESPFLQ